VPVKARPKRTPVIITSPPPTREELIALSNMSPEDVRIVDRILEEIDAELAAERKPVKKKREASSKGAGRKR
jgi:hypothetical protein